MNVCRTLEGSRRVPSPQNEFKPLPFVLSELRFSGLIGQDGDAIEA